jgi:uncharacterized protein (AIM24 family)/Flp pilus assembly protein TadD
MKNSRPPELDDIRGWSANTEDFLAQLHRSSELLRDNRSDEARQLLEKAFETREGDAYGQATLALVYFKLGIYPRAVSIYLRLIEEYPSDATLRLNVALVFLKTGQTQKARANLEQAIELRKDYRKAHGYLGLVCQQLGDYKRAREAFENAGANHMASRMARFIEPDRVLVEPVEEDNETADGAKKIEAEIGEFVGGLPFPSVTPSFFQGDNAATEPLPITELVEKSRLPEPLTGNFLVTDSGFLLMNIHEKGFARLDGLEFICAEQLSYKPTKRNYRGRKCEEIFGAHGSPLLEIRGNGRLGFSANGNTYSPISLDGEMAYIREEFVIAFDSELGFENGRMPGTDSILVQFAGTGSFVLATPGEPRSMEVTPERGVVIPARNLIGWFGRMMPRLASNSPFDPSDPAIEMVGEGVVLFGLPK